MLVARAPAKINWTLEVLGMRADGYHEIASAMSTISLADTLVLLPAFYWGMAVECARGVRGPLDSRGNLVYRATLYMWMFMRRDVSSPPASFAWKARALVPHFEHDWLPGNHGGPAGYFHLTKRVPIAAGLGGGSSDAAAALRLLVRHWLAQPDMAASDPSVTRALLGVAAEVGSDVPFFVRGGTQLALGRGERLEPLPDPGSRWIVLLVPPIDVERKTATLYSLLEPRLFTDGSRSRALAQKLAAGDGGQIGEEDVFNAFEAVAPTAFPGIDDYRRLLTEATGAPAHLCGAGPTLFSLVADGDAGYQAAAKLRAKGLIARAARITSFERAAIVSEVTDTSAKTMPPIGWTTR